MSKLTCDDCGTINSETRRRCELCGATLQEEKDRKTQHKNLLLAPIAWAFSAAVLFGVYFFGVAWYTTRGESSHGRHVSALDLFGVLNDPGEVTMWAGLLTAVTLVVGYIYHVISSN